MATRTPQHVREEQLNLLPGKRFVRWVGCYSNSKSKAEMRCSSGHVWEATVENLVNSKSGCPKCAKNRADESDTRLRVSAIPGVTFLKWVSGYKNRYSVAEVICDKGHVSAAEARNLLRGTGCPACATNKTKSKAEYEMLINASERGRFVTWEEGYSNSRSKAMIECANGHTWCTSVDIFVRGTGCPFCAKYGFDKSKPGAVYALLSECGGHIKIGISNFINDRIKSLRRATPFGFNLVATYNSEDGGEVFDIEAEFHRSFESSGFKDFDGATEWLKFDSLILDKMFCLTDTQIKQNDMRSV